MNTYSVNGTYGSSKTPCTVFCAENRDGSIWYAVEDSQNVNLTYDAVLDGVDVEMLSDIDAFTWPDGVSSEEELENAIDA